MACSKTVQKIPDHIMVGRVVISLDNVNRREIAYQGWLSMAGSKHWGNANVYINPQTKKYTYWLDYGDMNSESTVSTVTSSGKLSAITQMELNKIGTRILKEYAYKETLRGVASYQKSRRH